MAKSSQGAFQRGEVYISRGPGCLDERAQGLADRLKLLYKITCDLWLVFQGPDGAAKCDARFEGDGGQGQQPRVRAQRICHREGRRNARGTDKADEGSIIDCLREMSTGMCCGQGNRMRDNNEQVRRVWKSGTRSRRGNRVSLLISAAYGGTLGTHLQPFWSGFEVCVVCAVGVGHICSCMLNIWPYSWPWNLTIPGLLSLHPL